MRFVRSARRPGRTRELGAAATTLLALLSACSKEDKSHDPLTALEHALDSRPDVDVDALNRALESFASEPPKDAIPLVLELASDQTLTEEVRFTAVAVLGRMRDPLARASLARIAETDPSDLVRDEAKEALSRGVGGP